MKREQATTRPAEQQEKRNCDQFAIILTTTMTTTTTTTTMAFIYTADEILSVGLELVGFSPAQQGRVNNNTNHRRFIANYGSKPVVYAMIWEDMLTVDDAKARIDPTKMSLNYFLLGIYFLRVYPTEEIAAGRFTLSERTVRKWCWVVAEKLQAMKFHKVSRPTCSNNNTNRCPSFLMCTHSCLFLLLFFLSDCLARGMARSEQQQPDLPYQC